MQQLSDQAGGGNQNARQTWLGKLDGNLLLRPGDSLQDVKNFVNDAYNHKRYWKDPQMIAKSASVAAEGTQSASASTASLPRQSVGEIGSRLEGPMSEIPDASTVRNLLDLESDCIPKGPARSFPTLLEPSTVTSCTQFSERVARNGLGDRCPLSGSVGQTAASKSSSSLMCTSTIAAPQPQDMQFGDFLGAFPPSNATPGRTPASLAQPGSHSNQALNLNDDFGEFMSSPPSQGLSMSTQSMRPVPLTAPQPRPSMVAPRVQPEDPFAMLVPDRPALASIPLSHLHAQKMHPVGLASACVVGSGGHASQVFSINAPHSSFQPGQVPLHMVMNATRAHGWKAGQQCAPQEPDPFADLDWRK